jgi:hypothetical protein
MSQTVLILKYIIPQYDGYIYYGGATVGMNAGIMISYVPSLCVPIRSISPCYLPIRMAAKGHRRSASREGVLIISAIVLWIAQSGSDEYEYQLTV